MKKTFCLILICACLLLSLNSCGNKLPKVKLENGVELAGEPALPDQSKVVLYFTTRQYPTQLFDSVRKARATSQYLAFDENGNLLNFFTTNREMLGNPMVELSNGITAFYVDHNLTFTRSQVSYQDDESQTDMPSYTHMAPRTTGYLPNRDLAYAVLNFGSTILRFSNTSISYDVVIPYSTRYISYDEVNDRFLYALSVDSNTMQYGWITYSEEQNRYVVEDPNESISRKAFKDKYSRDGTAYTILVSGDEAYEISHYPLNSKAIAAELQITEQIPYDGTYGIFLLNRYNLKTHTMSTERLPVPPIRHNSLGHVFLSGTQEMPETARNGKLYFFTTDEKMYIFDPQSGLETYDIHFDFTNTRNSYDWSDPQKSGGPTLGDGSPLRIDYDGNIYTAHVYQDGCLKVHRYNFDTQKFDLYWKSNFSVLENLKKDSLDFESFEILH